VGVAGGVFACAAGGGGGGGVRGGGLGGATVSLIETAAADAIAENFIRKYKERTGYVCQTFVCAVADGAR